MPAKIVSFTGIILGLSLCYLVLVGCSPALEDDSHRIRQRLEAIQQLAKKKDSAALLGFLTEDFTGNQYLAKSQMQGLMTAYFWQNPVITITLSEVEITVTAEQISGDFKLLLTGGEGVVPDRLRWLSVKTQWVKLNGRWLIRRAQWQDVGSEIPLP
ncbi:MAG: nuclear transport factor 2 family protein [Gammaproteobacteria bacterium]|nr:nuclear transport factor 2 family protein [Gammaproteobacteria bacterium]